MIKARHIGATVGAARVMSQGPLSDGSVATEITNFQMSETGVLEARFDLMPLIPDEWRGAAQPEPFTRGVVAMGVFALKGESPELLFVTPGDSKDGSLWRYTPWARASGGTHPGLEVQQAYVSAGTTASPVYAQERTEFPPMLTQAGDTVVVSFCDGGGLWVWDTDRLRPFGFSSRPGPPSVDGPSRLSSGAPNAGGFGVRGRIGTTDGTWTDSAGDIVGGIDVAEYRYASAWEGPTGAYSATSEMSGPVSIALRVADPSAVVPVYPDELLRRFRVSYMAPGPVGCTEALVLLRTPNLRRLPQGDTGALRFCRRFASAEAIEWIDDTPDGELGGVWDDREPAPAAYFTLAHDGSLWLLRTDGYPARAWFTEQTENGPVYESVLRGHWLDVFPETGPVRGGLSTRLANQDGPVLLVGKSNAMHYVAGTYPAYSRGTLHRGSGLCGPRLIKAVPDGSVIWFGSGTFWRLAPDGAVSDIGGPIREYLDNVDLKASAHGDAWVDPAAGEAVFVLHVRGQDPAQVAFVWDYRMSGWRTTHDVAISAACVLPDGDVLVAGTYDATTTVWARNRGYPGYTVTAPGATYTCGWVSLGESGVQIPETSNLTDVVVLMEEACEDTATAYVLKNWNADDPSSQATLELAHPENDNIAFYVGGTRFASYDSDVWRSRRVYTHSIPAGATSGSVFAVSLQTSRPLGLVSMYIYGPKVAEPAARNPRTLEG